MVNNLKKDVDFFWQWNESGYLTHIKAEQKKIFHLYIPSGVSPNALTFKGHSFVDQIPVKLNSKDALQVKPSLKEKYTRVYVDGEG